MALTLRRRIVSQGILLYFMLTGALPFDHLAHHEMAERRQVLGTSALVEETWDHISGKANRPRFV